MAHWPKTVSGNLFTLGLIAVVVPLIVWFVITLPAWVLMGLAVVALAAAALVLWRRRLEAARERAWVGEFSFGDVVRRRHSAEQLEAATP
jgi:membrane protein implicated in regulation of membrane protease activity